jgi:hypothetical protein
MSLHVEPATSKHDGAIVELFTDLELTIDPRFWERAFSRQAPEGTASRAFVVVDDSEEGSVRAFAAVRPIELFVEGEFTKAQVLHDLAVRPGLLEAETAGLLLKEVVRRAEVTLCAGAGVEPTRVLERERFQCVGFFGRAVWTADSGGRRSPLPPMQLEPAGHSLAGLSFEELNGSLATERLVFRRRTGEQLAWMFQGPTAEEFEVLLGRERTALDAYVVLRRVPGLRGEELQLVDAACPSVEVPRLACGLAELARSRGLPLHVSLFGTSWGGALAEAGFQMLRPRWPLYWMLRDPRHRAMGLTLLRRDAWYFTASDGEIDRW